VGKPYRSELAALPETYSWARTFPVAPLAKALQTVCQTPLVCVGSGGSLTTAHFAALLHAESTGQLARAMTPLELTWSNTNLRELAVLLVSAGGSNPDILGVFKHVVAREPKHMVVVCARADSPLTRLAAAHDWVRLFAFDLPGGKDGFLATNSLLASAVLLGRAYEVNLPAADPLPPNLAGLSAPSHAGHDAGEVESRCQPLWDRETLIVLYGPALQPVAADLESRFTEAALGHVQVADYRNFAHGRHHWLARHESQTAVLSLESEEDQALAERTLALLPASVPAVRFAAPGRGTRACLAGLLFSARLAGAAGEAREIDPGAPRVPHFGRAIYHLQTYGPSPRMSSLSFREQVAIERKTGAALSQLERRGELEFWRDAYQTFTRNLRKAAFDRLILDYDGTLCDECDKMTGLRAEVTEHLTRLLSAGLHIGIATGRGESVREDLRRAIPPSLWGLVLVGYRNGAEIAPLTDDSFPSQSDEVGEELESVARRIGDDPLLARLIGRARPRWKQISVHPRPGVHVQALWERLSEVACEAGRPGVKVLQSSHSIDVIAPGVSKRALAERLAELGGAAPQRGQPLCIGDRGRWPGNDCELLQAPHSLSVDEVSSAPGTCWLLSSPGERGVQAALEYLAGLGVEGGVARARLGGG
jgi:fructoselysine-6-P-deglycase FrlB-like protein